MPADLAVIGLGHLGLPLAQAAVTGGIATIGYDPVRAVDLASGRLPCDGAEGTLTAAEVRRMLSGASGRPPIRWNSAGSAPRSSALPLLRQPTAAST